MGTLSNTYSNYALDLLLGKGSNASVAPTFYIGLSSTQATSTATGAGLTEPSIGVNGYARVVFTNDGTWWNAASARAKTNAAPVTFPISTAAWLSSTAMGYFSIWDAASAGNFVCWGSLNSTVTVSAANTIVSIPPGSLSIAITGGL